jgi:hypothetical protein
MPAMFRNEDVKRNLLRHPETRKLRKKFLSKTMAEYERRSVTQGNIKL